MHTRLAGDEIGLVGYWRFEKESDALVEDSTGRGNGAKFMDGAMIHTASGPPIRKVKTAKVTQVGNKPKTVAPKTVARQPVASKPVASKPVARQPVANKPVARQPITTYTLKFASLANGSVSNIREDHRNPGHFTYTWVHVCGVCGWRSRSGNTARAGSGNGGFTKSFSCFDCFKAKRPNHNSGSAHMTKISWTINKKVTH